MDWAFPDKRGLRLPDKRRLGFHGQTWTEVSGQIHLEFFRHTQLGFPSCPQLELSRHLLLLEATKTKNRATVARWLGADLPPSVLEGGAREAGGPGPPRVIPRRDVVNRLRRQPVDTFAERHPANPPTRRLLSNISSDIPSTNRNQQQLDFVRKKGVLYGQVSQNDNSSVKRRGFPDKRELRLPDKRGLGFPGQTWTGAIRTNAA